jgi:DNA-binding NtrC family response regulator
MKGPIIVIDADKGSRRELCNLLEAQDYQVIPSHSLAGFPGLIQGSSCRAVILDLDTVPVNNRQLRDLKKTYPDVYVVAVSDRSFHPELKEAMAAYIYACLCKPIDPDELVYWLKSIFCTETASEDGPAHNEWNAFR